MESQLKLEHVIGKFVVCPSKNCGVVSNPGFNFCFKCGQKIKHEKLRTRLPKPRILEDGTNTHIELGGLTPSEFREAAQIVAKATRPGVKGIDLRGLPKKAFPAVNELLKHVGSARGYVEANAIVSLPPKVLEALRKRNEEEK